MVGINNTQAFSLKLNSHQTHVTEQFQKLYNDEVLVDCTISCPTGTVKAHKLVLSACSPYFTSVFATFTNPYQYPVIILKDITYGDLKYIIEYCYRGEVTVPQSNLASVLDVAKALNITGLCDIKIAATTNPKQPPITSSITSQGAASGTSKQAAASVPAVRKRGKARKSKSGSGSEVSEASGEESESEITEKKAREAPVDESQASNDASMAEFEDADEGVTTTVEEVDEGESSHNLRSPKSQTPSATMKANLRQQRIEKMQQASGGVSAGRKMWSDEETRSLVKVWEEESARVWASAGRKTLALQKISELLMENENVDRDVSQVEGKIKALKRDYKAVKSDKAIASVQTRMAPYLEKLDLIFSRDDTE